MLRRTLFQSALLLFIKVVDLPVWGLRWCHDPEWPSEDEYYLSEIGPNTEWWAWSKEKPPKRFLRKEVQAVMDQCVPFRAELVFLP
jgi:hypothetical protein